MSILQQACLQVQGFETFYQKFLRRITIDDRALSTSTNYARSLASIALHFNRVPTHLSLDEIEEYLYLAKLRSGTVSENHFKFAICSLRFAFRMEGLDELRLKLPVIRRKRKLPTILSKEEITRMMNSPYLLMHRVIIAVLYGCGLRCGEVRNIMVSDIDFDRGLLHVRQAKGKKDRLMPLGNTLSNLLGQYIQIRKVKSWLFPGKRRSITSGRSFVSVFEPQFGQRSIQWAIKRAAKLAGIVKPVNVHCLRHTYATHLLEDGVNILTIKELLGHANISTTMIYLHVAQVNNHQKYSPLDKMEDLHIIGTLQGKLF